MAPGGRFGGRESLWRRIAREFAPTQKHVAAGLEGRISARNAVIGSAVSLCPLSALLVIVGLVVNAKVSPMPDFLLRACLSYPVVGITAVVLGLLAHGRGWYAAAGAVAVVPPVVHVGVVIGGFGWWLAG